jgi:adenylate cyclase
VVASEQDPKVVDDYRRFVVEGVHGMRLLRRAFRALPSSPRCKVCYSPFRGVGGRLVKPFGFTPYRKNPSICAVCCEHLPVGGVEADIAVLFADVRGSTTLASRPTRHPSPLL